MDLDSFVVTGFIPIPWHLVGVVLVAPALILLPAGSTDTDQPPSVHGTRDRDFVPTVFGVSGVEPLTSACFTREFSFTGRLYSISPGQPKRPMTNALLSRGSQDAIQMELSDEGEFSESVPVWTHYFDGKRSSPKTRVTVSAAGCKSKVVRIREHSRPMTLVLKCLRSKPE